MSAKSVNPCFKCREKCCINVYNSRDLVMPPPNQQTIDINTTDFLARHPSFSITSHVVVETTTTSTVLPRFTCNKYDPKTGICTDHENRYDLCKSAGVDYPASDKCLLWQSTHPQKPLLKRLFR